MRRIWWFLTLAAWCLPIGAANASINYTYSTDSTTYSAASAGATVTVNIYLNENLSGASSSLIVADGGLFGAGFYVNAISGNASTITTISGNQNASAPGSASDGFTNQSNVVKGIAANSLSASLIEGAGTSQSSGPIGAALSGGRQILLGSLTITAGAAGSSTTYSLLTLKNAPSSIVPNSGGNNGNTIDFNGNDMDVSSTNPAYTGANSTQPTGFQFTVTVQGASVPEPSSMLLCGLAASGMGFGAWRRRKARLQVETVEAKA
jgi:hypothetical protein